MVVTNIYDLLKTLNNVVEIANSESVTGKALLLADNDNGHALERARVYIVETRKGVYRCNVWIGKKYQYIDDISKLISKKRSIDNNTECKYTRIAENELINVMKRLCDIQASRQTATKKVESETA